MQSNNEKLYGLIVWNLMCHLPSPTHRHIHIHTSTHIDTHKHNHKEGFRDNRCLSRVVPQVNRSSILFSLEPSSPVAQVYLELDAEQMTLNIDFRVLGLQTCTQAQFCAVPVIKSWALCILGWHSANR